jgi:hypothetical protein
MARITRSNIMGNKFYANAATKVGTIYWISSTMAEPRQILTNTFQQDICAYHECSIATEACNIYTLSPTYLVLEDYDPAAYPINIRVGLVDYYNQIVSNVEEIPVEAYIRSSLNVRCGANEKYSGIDGELRAIFVNGIAHFQRISGRCVPGGYINISFGAVLSSVSSSFPDYKLKYEANIYSESNKKIEKASKIRVVSDAQLYFRKCVRGEVIAVLSDMRRICSLCQDSYSVDEDIEYDDTSCESCPVGAGRCEGAEIYMKEGTWRWNAEARTIYPCPMEHSCKGGNETGNGLCNPGYHDAFCSVCILGYHIDPMTKECKSCSEGINSSQVYIVGCLLVTIFLYIVCRRFHITWESVWTKISGKIDVQSENENDIDSRQEQTRDGKSVRSFIFLKILVSTVQLIANSPLKIQAFNMPVIKGITRLFAVLNFDFTNLLPLTCYFPQIRFLEIMMISTALPFLLTFTLYVAYRYEAYKACAKISRATIRNSVRAQYRNRYISLFLVCSYYMLPDLATKIGRSLSCINIDIEYENKELVDTSRQRLLADLAIECSSSSYRWKSYWAIAMFLVYPIGIPTFYFYLLYKYQATIKHRDRMLKLKLDPPKLIFFRRKFKFSKIPKSSLVSGLAFIFESYKPALWYVFSVCLL